jgi:hypothetical protein
MCLSGLSAFAVDVFDVSFALNRRIGVGHTYDGGVSGRHCGSRTASDGFFLFVTRLTEMDVNIYKAWRDQFTGGVDYHISFFVNVPYLGDLTVADEHITFLVPIVSRVDYTTVSY